MTPSLADFGIGLNCNPPKNEPGTKYQIVGTGELLHKEAVELAIQQRKTHPNEAVEIWATEGDMRLVVREVVK